MTDHRTRFLQLALDAEALRFGEFTLKSGRVSPYFFNAGRFDHGASLAALATCYADAIDAAGVEFDLLFGPAYKGIPLVAVVAVALAQAGLNLPFSFNRKETKDHGEGGCIVGAPLAGRVLIVDDVISAGTSVRESVELICSAGATPCGVVIALDRMERGRGELSAVQEVRRDYGIPVVAVASLDDLLAFLHGRPDFSHNEAAVASYRQEYGIARGD